MNGENETPVVGIRKHNKAVDAAPAQSEVMQVTGTPEPAKEAKGAKKALVITQDAAKDAFFLNLITDEVQRKAELKKNEVEKAADRVVGRRLHGQIQRSKPFLVRATDWVAGSTLGRAALILVGGVTVTATGMVFSDRYQEYKSNQGL